MEACTVKEGVTAGRICSSIRECVLHVNAENNYGFGNTGSDKKAWLLHYRDKKILIVVPGGDRLSIVARY